MAGLFSPLLVLLSLFSSTSAVTYSPPSLSSSYAHLPPELPPMGNCPHPGLTTGNILGTQYWSLFPEILGIESAMFGFQSHTTPVSVGLMNAQIICRSGGTRNNTFTSAAVLVTYSCHHTIPACAYVGTGILSDVFYIKCKASDNTWDHYYSELNEPYTDYSDAFSLFITNRDPHDLVTGGVSYGLCSYCYNVQQYVGPIQFHGLINYQYQCQG